MADGQPSLVVRGNLIVHPNTVADLRLCSDISVSGNVDISGGGYYETVTEIGGRLSQVGNGMNAQTAYSFPTASTVQALLFDRVGPCTCRCVRRGGEGARARDLGYTRLTALLPCFFDVHDGETDSRQSLS